jgi:hypothetical protein
MLLKTRGFKIRVDDTVDVIGCRLTKATVVHNACRWMTWPHHGGDVVGVRGARAVHAHQHLIGVTHVRRQIPGPLACTIDIQSGRTMGIRSDVRRTDEVRLPQSGTHPPASPCLIWQSASKSYEQKQKQKAWTGSQARTGSERFISEPVIGPCFLLSLLLVTL